MLTIKTVFLRYILPSKKLFISFCCFNFLSLVIFIYSPFLLSSFIDTGIIANDIHTILRISLTIIFLYTIGSIFAYFSNIISAKLSAKAYLSFNFTILEHIQHVPIKFYESSDTAYLSSRMNEDTEDVISFVLNNLFNVIINTLMIIAISIIIIIQSNIYMFLLFILTCIIDLIFYSLYKKKIFMINLEKKELENIFFSSVNYQLKKIKFIKINVLYSFLKEISLDLYNNFIASIYKYSRINNCYLYFGKGLKNISIVASLLLGGIFCACDILQIGVLISLIAYLNIGYGCLNEFHDFGQKYQDVNVSLSRINELLFVSPEPSGTVKPKQLSVITIKNLSFSHDGIAIFSSLNLTMKKNNIYILEGANGSGKSTFTHLLLKLYSVENDTIFLDEVDINDIDTDYLRKSIVAYMGQEPSLINKDIDTNLFLDGKRDSVESGWFFQHILSTLSFLGKYAALKNSGTPLYEGDCIVSGGEKQKIAIIRTLLKDTPVLIFDEPTSALDDAGVHGFINIINRVKKDKIIIIITHDKHLEILSSNIITFSPQAK